MSVQQKIKNRQQENIKTYRNFKNDGKEDNTVEKGVLWYTKLG